MDKHEIIPDIRKFLYHYRARVIKVTDGDSIYCNFDMGFGIKFDDQRVRLADIDAPETKGEERELGLISSNILTELILGKDVYIETVLNTKYREKKGKWGRWLAIIWLVDGTNVNQWLVDNGYAVKYKE